MATKTKTRARKAPKSRTASRRCAVSTGSAIPFVNKDGHVIRLSRSMTLRELVKMGFVEIHLAKPGTPLRDGEWRDATPDAPSPNVEVNHAAGSARPLVTPASVGGNRPR